MSNCKAVIDLWDAMQSTPRCFFLFLLFFIVVVVFPPFIFPLRPVNVQFPPLPYCAITLPKNDFKTYFITTCKYQRCPNTVAKKIYKCCFILFFSIFWTTTMMFMWCIVFQLVAIIKKYKLQKKRFVPVFCQSSRLQKCIFFSSQKNHASKG